MQKYIEKDKRKKGEQKSTKNNKISYKEKSEKNKGSKSRIN